MNAPDRLLDWSDANQRLLVAEFARLAALLGDGPLEVTETNAAVLRAAMPTPAASAAAGDPAGSGRSAPVPSATSIVPASAT